MAEESTVNGQHVTDKENKIKRENMTGRGNPASRKNETDGKSIEINGELGKRKKTVTISRRMRMLADMVTAGSRVADVGCDHAFLPVYLVQAGKCPKCLAMDVRKGPLSAAKEHIVSYGLEEYIETRLSDGLSAYHTGEAQTLICAGMGGRLMEKILTEGGEKSRSFSELILQPQSEIPEFRIFLRNAGFLITEEEAVHEDGKYYFAMKAVYRGRDLSAEQSQSAKPETFTGQSPALVPQMAEETGGLTEYEIPGERKPMENILHDLYGKQLLIRKHPVLKQYLLKRRKTVEELITQLGQKDSIKSESRKRELFLEKEHLERALDLLRADE